MSEAITFDTHRFIKRLTETGMSEATAEALADEQINLLNGNLATKQQLADTAAGLEVKIAEVEAKLSARISEVEAELSARISEVEAKLSSRISETKADLLKWMVGLLVAQTGLIISVVKFIP